MRDAGDSLLQLAFCRRQLSYTEPFARDAVTGAVTLVADHSRREEGKRPSTISGRVLAHGVKQRWRLL
jgi:hypothetical protein